MEEKSSNHSKQTQNLERMDMVYSDFTDLNVQNKIYSYFIMQLIRESLNNCNWYVNIHYGLITAK